MVDTRLIDLRESRNLKQKDVAQALNIPTRTYGNYEMGTRSIPLDILIEIAKFYNTSTDYILKVKSKNESYTNE